MANNIKLTIEGQIVEVVEDTIDMDYSITRIEDMGSVDSDRSLPIIAPYTQANNLVFEHLHDYSIENELPLRRLKCTLDDGGTSLLKSGVCRIKKAGRAYELELGGGNYSLLDVVGDLKLQELDLAEYDHFWTLANVHASRNNTEGYIYLANNYFVDSSSSLIDNIDRVIRADYIYPCVFVHTLLKKMGEYAGVSITGDLLNTQAFKDLVLPFTRRDYIRNSVPDRYLIDVSTPFDDGVSTGPAGGLIWNVLNSSGGNYFTATSGNYGNQLQFADEVTIKGQMKLTIVNSNASARTLTISRLESRFLGTVGAFQQFDTVVNIPGNTTLLYEYNFEATAENNNDNQTVTFSFLASNTGLTIQAGANLKITYVEIFRTQEISYTTPFGASNTINYVNLSSALPDMKCGDLLKALANMYGLLFQYDELTNSIKVEQISKVYENKSLAEDWTAKIVPSSAVFEYELGGFGQINRMLLTNPDANDRLEGSYTFTIPNEHLQPEKEVFKLPFQFTGNSLLLEDLVLAHIPLLGAEEDPDNPGQYLYSLNNESKPRILTVSRETLTGDLLDYYDGTSTLTSTFAPLGYYYREGAANNLDLNTLINTYQAFRIAMLQKGRKVTLDVDLTSADIESLDFFVPVYISTWAKFFYKNKVSRPNKELSKVVLVEL